MRVAAVGPDRALRVEDRPEPVAGASEVVVAVERCGICGSDLHFRNSGFLPAGTVMGHEFSGRVVAVGAEADRSLAGTTVAVVPSVPCGACGLCTAGRDHLCSNRGPTSLGLGVNDGAYAELVRVPAAACHVLPAGMTTQQGALVEPYAVALHAVRRSRATPATRVGIIGAGPVGLLTLAALREAGVEDVVVAERSGSRAAVADTLGARDVVDDVGRLGPVEVVFDCAGSPATTPLALEQVSGGGQILLVGAVDIGEHLAMPGLLWLVKEVDVLPSIGYSDEEFAEAVVAVAGGAVDAATVVTDVRPLEDAERSFSELASPGGPVKVLLDPSA